MNKRGFTGLEVLGVIFIVIFGVKLAVRTMLPKQVRQARCSAAAKTLSECGPKNKAGIVETQEIAFTKLDAMERKYKRELEILRISEGPAK